MNTAHNKKTVDLDPKKPIFLIDSSLDPSSLKSKFYDSNIITFDYESHVLLSDNGVTHCISDIFVNKNELAQLQKLSFDLTRWSTQNEVQKYVEFDDINLGNLFLIEFLDVIPSFIKKFFEVMKIDQQYQNCKFLAASPLFEMVKTFSNYVTKLDKLKPQDIKNNNAIKHSYRIADKEFSVNISRSQYLKLKNLSEKFLQRMFVLDKKSSTNNILLIEFDPVRYKKFLFTSKEKAQNIILFNRRRPVVWNLESFSIIKKSNCKIATFNGLADTTLKSVIRSQTKILEKNLAILWQNDDFFKNFFVISKTTFWNAFKPQFTQLANQRMLEAITEIELSKKLFKEYSIKAVVIFSEAGFNERIAMQVARKNNVPVFLLQHGIPYETSDVFERNNLLGFFPNFSDKIVVWGKSTQKYVEKSGISLTKIAQLGTPLYDELFLNPQSSTNQKTILLATSPPMKDFVYDLTVEINENYHKAIERICQIISKKNRKLIIKLHPSLADFKIDELTKKIDPKISIFKTDDIFPLIKSCDILVTFDLSTTILEAQILQKPVISISLKDYGFGKSEIFESRSCIQTTIENFEVELEKILTDANYKKQIIENEKKFVDYYLTNKGNASEHILGVLKIAA